MNRPSCRLTHASTSCISKPTLDCPSPQRKEAALQFIQATTTDLSLPETDPQVWAELCHVLINAKEFIYIQ